MIAMKEKEEEYTHVSIYFCRENYYRGSKEIKKYKLIKKKTINDKKLTKPYRICNIEREIKWRETHILFNKAHF